MSRFAATNSMSGNEMFVAFLERGVGRYVHVSRYDGSSWSHVSTISSFDSHSHPAIASKNDLDVFLAYKADYDRCTGVSPVFIHTSTNGGSTWTPRTEISGSLPSANPGVAATYDPESDNWIAVWRESQNSSAQGNTDSE